MATVNLRNTSGEPLILGIGGRRVEVDEVIHVEGSVDKKSPDDAYLINGRLWPKATWTNAGGSPNTEPDVTEES